MRRRSDSGGVDISELTPETLADLRTRGAEVAREASDQGWGLVAAIRLPDGSEFPIYQPRHPSPLRPA